MMKLPNADAAIVEEPTVRDYLLNSDHPHGLNEARFFESVEFAAATWGSWQTR